MKQEIDKIVQRRNRSIATVIGAVALTSLIAFVFAFFQKAEADKQRMFADINEKTAIELRGQVDELKIELAKCQSENK